MTRRGDEVSGAETLTLLVVDDEPAWVGALGAVLGKAGHRIVAAYDGEEALRRFRTERIDAVLLDLAMPGMDGSSVARQMRAESDVPILIVSGERDPAAPAELLDLGADDYIRKSMPNDEKLARIRAAVRRRAPSRATSGWTLDARRHEIAWRNQVVPATAIEFRLLEALVTHLGELRSHAELLAAGWPGVGDPDPLWLKPHLARLRDKLVRLAAPTPTAVRAVGYRLDA
ncbi:MAG: response regulator transcription factor [Candidatus Limnocylindrales bacterium]